MLFLGFTDETIKWYTSNLSNGKFIISMEKANLDKGSIKSGVPQSSILGSLLFLIYINDMPNAVDNELLLYVDDTCQHRNIKTIEEHLNRDFSTLVDWFVDNRLSMYILVRTKQNPFCFLQNRSKSIGQIDISYKDECLAGESMAMQICTKVTSKLKSLY